MSRGSSAAPTVRRAALIAAGLALALGGCAAGQLAQTAYERSTVDGASGQVGTIAVRNITIAFPASGRYVKGESAQLEFVAVNEGDQADRLVDVRTGVATNVLIGSSASASATPTETETATATPTATGTATPTATGTATPTATGTATGTGTGTPTTTASGATPTGTASGTAPGTPTGTATGTATGAGATVTATATSPAPQTSVPAQLPAEGILSFGNGTGPTVTLAGLTDELLPTETVQITFVFERAGEVTVVVPVGTPATPLPPPSTVDGVNGESTG